MKQRFFVFLLVVFAILFCSSLVNAKIFTEEGKSYVEQELEEGWNLIAGISFSEDLHENSEIELDSILSSYYYDAETKKDIEIRPLYEAGDINPLVLYGHAFWVYSAKKGKIVYKVSPSFIDKSLSGHDNLYSGWNPVAINQEMYGKSWEEFRGNCEFLEAKIWEPEQQDWSDLNLDSRLNFESEEELTGKGINIRVEENCKFMKQGENGGGGGGGGSSGGGRSSRRSNESGVNISTVPPSPDTTVSHETPAIESSKEEEFTSPPTESNISIYFIIFGILIILVIIIIILRIIFRKKESKIVEEGLEIGRMNKLIEEANILLNSGQNNEASKKYLEIMGLYNSLSDEDKTTFYPKIIEFYNKLNAGGYSGAGSLEY